MARAPAGVRSITRPRTPPSWSALPLDVRVPCSRVEYDEAIPFSAQAEPVAATSAATTNIDAFMLWITPLRDAPPDNWLPHRQSAPGIGKPINRDTGLV